MEHVVEHVMVPVPAEMRKAVERYLMQIDMASYASRPGDEIDLEKLRALLTALRAPCRSILKIIAHSAAVDVEPTIADLASAMQCSHHETLGIVHETSELLWSTFGPKLSVVPTESTDHSTGAVDWTTKKVIIWKDLATAVVTVEDQMAAEG